MGASQKNYFECCILAPGAIDNNHPCGIPWAASQQSDSGEMRILWHKRWFCQSGIYRRLLHDGTDIHDYREYTDFKSTSGKSKILDLVLAVDDDFIYPNDIIETFLTEHKKTPQNPLSGNDIRVNGVVGHCGCASLVKSEYYGRYLDDLMDDTILSLKMDDIYYVFCAALNGVRYRFVGKLFYTNMRPIDSTDGLSDENRNDSNEMMRNYLVNKIGSSYHINMMKINKPYFTL